MHTERRIHHRRYLGPNERRRVAERFESSGLTRREFAKRSKVSVSSLNRWLAEARNPASTEQPVVFREVTLSPAAAPSSMMAWALELASADGITIRCREGLSVRGLAQLLRGRSC